MFEKIRQAVDKHAQKILDAQNYIWANPETGYREFKTSAYMEKAFREMGYDLVLAGDIPGFYTVVDTGRPGPEVLILGELDALICPEHPDADPVTGAVHCCGHSAQCAALLGIAAARKVPGILDDLSGRIRLCAVPAEELLEIGFRARLKEEGSIRYLGGKTEFLHRGYFDGVDLSFMIHSTSEKSLYIPRGCIGLIAKSVTYEGVSAHAGGSPWEGCNALYAASLGLQAINAIRETFRDVDTVRVHPIITKGGGAVNAIPDQVCLESYVRGNTFDIIYDANRKINRALCGAALSLGANVDIQDFPGYAPLYNCDAMRNVAREAAAVLPEVPVDMNEKVSTGSTDMGDLSLLMPVVHPYMPGATGKSHGTDYYIPDPMLTCVGSAKWQVAMLTLLLENGAARAKKIVGEHTPVFSSKEAYFAMLERFEKSGRRIRYENGQATVVLDKEA